MSAIEEWQEFFFSLDLQNTELDKGPDGLGQ